ncbi:MAG TPA: carboxypeptidase-like regulatory domain-containing protein [Candidatus Acidoferrum sp.]|nr:carboxypeptidase-like regulatory domain-containing protein [Candidatus Acidoferrum sp.]
MKTNLMPHHHSSFIRYALGCLALLLPGLAMAAVTFTNNTAINALNTNYDGMDIVVTNCTLTVDGAHSFASLQVLDGANLTHTAAPAGTVDVWASVSNELQVLSATNAATLSNAYVLPGSIVVQDPTGQTNYGLAVDYTLDVDSNGMTTLLLLPNSNIPEGSTNLVSYSYRASEVTGGLSLTVTGDVTVAQGGTINTDGRGYSGGIGPGAGSQAGSPLSGSGGGQGGTGGQSASLASGGFANDSLQQPTYLGSGGGSGSGGLGGTGGGSIKLVVGGTLRVDGTVSANGSTGLNERSGGGSGGSVWLSAQTFAGNGLILANGGAGEPAQGGGGGGGRVAVWYGVSSFGGTMATRGGSGYQRGGAGTIYTRVNSQPAGQVLVDNGGKAGAATMWLTTPEFFDVTVQGGAMVSLVGAPAWGNLLVASNASVSVPYSIAGAISLTVTNNVTVQAGGSINADGLGNASGAGSGEGHAVTSAGSYAASGGGYGGYGGTASASAILSALGGGTYGSVTAPNELGSGGGQYLPQCVSGAGGGLVILTVNGMLLLDGQLSANGLAGVTEGGGGGSGGGIRLTVGTLAGAGTISANGGAGYGAGLGGGGGGGGGRIALQYGMNLFFGRMTAWGGVGTFTGGAGTIYTKANSQPSGLVLADNGGQAGTNTTFGSGSVGTVDLTVRNGAVLVPLVSQTVGTLLVGTNGWLLMSNQWVTVAGNATVQPGGGIIADATGYGAGLGTGRGGYLVISAGSVAGGGGYGGCGGSSGSLPSPSDGPAAGGTTYGYLAAPTDMGSGGGSPAGTVAQGGVGGGAIRLSVTGVLEVDGRISALGGAAPTSSGGGGSGGSIFLTVGTLTGAGTIAANGGMGNYLGGGGGGGRIAILYGGYDFTGLVSAYGGAGYMNGGAGTIFTMANNSPWGQVVADNGGQAGTNTSWLQTSTVDLTVRGGAVVSPPTSQSLGSVVVSSNGTLTLSSQILTVSGSMTVQAGGAVSADGTGYGSGQGTGAGRSYSMNGYVGGGGGYGGYGGSGASNTISYLAPGGTTYGSFTSPIDLGSGGGGYGLAYAGYANGGAGGGAVRLTVNGTLQVDGRLSARGLPASAPSAGGGSGGTINLSVGSLAGSGVISANGGAGLGLGGGGGGGRIAITLSGNANTFSGQMTAYGGDGYAVGGAGSIYVKPYNGSAPIVFDNGGQTGTNSGWPTGGTFDVTIKNGASLALVAATSVGNLVVGSNGWIYVSGQSALSGQTFSVNGNATIQAGGGIIADAGGYSYYNGGVGPGGGTYLSQSSGYVSSGGGFGGLGGASGGTTSLAGGKTSGLVTAGGAGSAGGTYANYFLGGAGGGAIILNVTGTLEVDGRISSAGQAGLSPNAGGGAGGGIMLTVGTLAGSGVIAANGGAGNGLGGGGGGGRIVVNYTKLAFDGLMTAYGGNGYNRGGAGTIYTKPNSAAWGQVLVDNGGQAGAITSWTSGGTLDLTISGGGNVGPQASSTYGNLLVTSNAWLSLTNQTITVVSNATVLAGGGIIADSAGYGGGSGLGSGKYVSTPIGYVGGGGAYGGYGAAGGAPSGYSAWGGFPYPIVTSPTGLGSGGGTMVTAGPATGSAGGGVVRLNVTGLLLVNGRVSANGGAGIAQGSGGGSGGSVWLNVGTLAGGGTISANGGAGNELGGGGGGGCVSVQYSTSAFEGLISAYGGGGYAWGGAGTVYTQAKSQITGQLFVDNGGNSGTNTPVPYLAPFDLTIRGGAVAYPSASPLLLSNLYVNSGGVFTSLNTSSNLDLTVLGNATVDASSAISVDAKGFSVIRWPGPGPGAGTLTNYDGSGGGYGGQGGASASGPGGGTYGSVQQPVDRGSSGGASGVGGGSEGGGAIKLTVGGLLALNGRLSAEGDAGLQDDSGGGSGGSVWVTAAALAGTGAITADGGMGQLWDGGGGGGGRIAVYALANSFTGSMSATGATGFFPGQNGSIYTSATPPPPVVTTSPTGTLNSAVGILGITFSTPVNAASVNPTTVGLIAPGGLTVSNLVVQSINPYAFQVVAPLQSAQGTYLITVGPGVQNFLGLPVSQVYTGSFAIAWSTVQGTVTDTNGLPVAGVVIQPDSGTPSTTTDTNGQYVLSVPPGVTFHVTPSAPGLSFIPSYRTYSSVSSPISGENYTAVSAVVPTLATQVQSNGLSLTWYGLSNVTYQPLYSTNLVDWYPYNSTIPGTNGPLELDVPLDTGPIMFFRMGVTY